MTQPRILTFGLFVLGMGALACGGESRAPDDGGAGGGNAGAGGAAGPGGTGGAQAGNGGAAGASGSPAGGAPPSFGGEDRLPGRTTFTSFQMGGPGVGQPLGVLGDFGTPIQPGATARRPSGVDDAPPPPGAPPVETADVYKLVGTKLYLANAYRGLLIYDIAVPQRPQRLSRLALPGTPVDMIVSGGTAHLFLSGTVSWTQTAAPLDLQRHEGSQVMSVDVSDPAKPRALKTVDLPGLLRAGSVRKIGDRVLAVSELRELGPDAPPEEVRRRAWVHAVDVATTGGARLADSLEIFNRELGSVVENGVVVESRFGNDLVVAATGTTLIVVEGWVHGANLQACSNSEAVVSIFDLVTPGATLRRRARFQTTGVVDDPAKLALRTDGVSGRDIFYGIFTGRPSTTCDVANPSPVMNTLETWDVTSPSLPQRLASLTIGTGLSGGVEPVIAAAFDFHRHLLVAAVENPKLTPLAPGGALFAIDIADAASPRVVSQTDSEDTFDILRLDGQSLVAIGPSDACATSDPSGVSMKVRLLDLRDVVKPAVVQERCIAVPGIPEGSAPRGWRADELLEVLQGAGLNLVTVPIGHTARERGVDVYWDHPETGLGVLSWDAGRYDAPERPPTILQQGTIFHPGAVPRSVLFSHPVTGEATLLVLGSSHLALVGLGELTLPRVDALVEVSPALDEVYAFGDHIVERVDRGTRGLPEVLAEFRVKQAGGPVDDRTVLSTFDVGQATAAYAYRKNVVVFRGSPAPKPPTGGLGGAPGAVDPGDPPVAPELVVYDVSTPATPRVAGRTTVAFSAVASWADCERGCRTMQFDIGQQTLVTDVGLLALQTTVSTPSDGSAPLAEAADARLVDLRNVAAPRLRIFSLVPPVPGGAFALVADPVSPRAFYLSQRSYVEQVSVGESAFSRYQYAAQRWQIDDSGQLTAGETINLPGTLARTWMGPSGLRMFATTEETFLRQPDGWHRDVRVNLLKQVGAQAQLLDTQTVADVLLTSLEVDNGRLVFTGRGILPGDCQVTPDGCHGFWRDADDRLLAFDLGAGKLSWLVDRSLPTKGMRVLRLRQGKVLASVPGDGLFVLDLSDPEHARVQTFLPTAGWPLHLGMAGADAYAAAGPYGLLDVDLDGPANVPAP